MTLSKITPHTPLKSSHSVTVTFSSLKIIMDYSRGGDVLSDFSQHYFELVNQILSFVVVTEGKFFF